MSYSIPAPVRRRYYLIFDTETTGLLPKKTRGRDQTSSPPIDAYPHILQLSYVVYDMYDRRIIKSYDSYVNVADNVEISEFVQELTGITRELCNMRGRNIMEVLESFYSAYVMCEGLVAHNMEFDEKMIMIEIERNRTSILEKSPHCFMLFHTMYETVHNIERYCTMRKGTALCNILFEPAEVMNDTVDLNVDAMPASRRKKFPKLAELYSKLFDGQVPDGLHNSMVDVLACLRCYLKMRHNMDVGPMAVIA